MRALLLPILLALALASCSERFEPAQVKLCRQAIPALNAPDTPIAIKATGPGPRPHMLRIDYVAGPASGPARRRSIDCLFAGDGQGQRRGALIGIASDGRPMSDANFYLLRRFYLENREEPPPDPGAPAVQGRAEPGPALRARHRGAATCPCPKTGVTVASPLSPGGVSLGGGCEHATLALRSPDRNRPSER
jgi:branched-chain amino acid transport system permease protein